MAYDFSSFKKESGDVHTWLRQEFVGLRSGVANPALLDKVQVDAYGARTPIEHVASISSEDPRTLRIAPWDSSMIQPIEHAIAAANLGISTATDERGVRVIFPELTEETRKHTVKILKDRYEEARIRVKHIREKTWSDIQEKEKEGEISEDERFALKDQLQKVTDEANSTLEDEFRKKENEIMNV
ncbi:MAG: ribosome recycling factor [bacterium]|nr:ribosome recycling factor [bacterium]